MGRAANGNGTIRKKTVMKNGKKYRLFPSRKFVDRDIIDNYYDAWKEKKAKENKPATANK